jgi:hypothetical protein
MLPVFCTYVHIHVVRTQNVRNSLFIPIQAASYLNLDVEFKIRNFTLQNRGRALSPRKHAALSSLVKHKTRNMFHILKFSSLQYLTIVNSKAHENA